VAAEEFFTGKTAEGVAACFSHVKISIMIIRKVECRGICIYLHDRQSPEESP
jgi:hypothetical protein